MMITKSDKTSTRKKKSARANAKTKTNADPDHRRDCIAKAAYYKAEKRGFEPGGEHEDWLAAEREFDDGAQDN